MWRNVQCLSLFFSCTHTHTHTHTHTGWPQPPEWASPTTAGSAESWNQRPGGRLEACPTGAGEMVKWAFIELCLHYVCMYVCMQIVEVDCKWIQLWSWIEVELQINYFREANLCPDVGWCLHCSVDTPSNVSVIYSTPVHSQSGLNNIIIAGEFCGHYSLHIHVHVHVRNQSCI